VSGARAHHPALARGAADLVGGQWMALPAVAAGAGRACDAREDSGAASAAGIRPDGAPGAGRADTEVGVPGEGVVARNPARPAQVVWAGRAEVRHVDEAVAAARAAWPAWAAAGPDRRFAALRRYQSLCREREQEIAEIICDETGKVMWEARQEAALLALKVEITLERSPHSGLSRVTDWQVPLGGGRTGRTIFRPHGVMAVVGPFNFPAHLPNGHIVPALAMGNTVVFKPSDKAPGVGQVLGELLAAALEAEGFGPGGGGIVNVVQGGAEVASRLVGHEGIDGVLFTGSWPVGRRIMEANLDRPGRILALEMGGNNAAVVMPDADLRQAAIEIVRCAFNTAGQRCTCTRRAVVHREVAGRLIPAICKGASLLVIGDPRADRGSGGTPVFMGPMIRDEARRLVVSQVAAMARGGGRVLVEPREPDVGGHGGWYLSPAVVQVERFVASDAAADEPGSDVEVFGPVLRVCVVDSLDEAIEQANATRFGLAASIFTRDLGAAERFLREARAGCVNVNTGTAGASSRLPFGGLGLSGNHRPAGAYSLDYCAYPVAAMVEAGGAATMAEGMRFEEAWLG
jgi:succinylglutamic semialdehyde dehydrogenase